MIPAMKRLALLAALLFASPAAAHHSFGVYFDAAKPGPVAWADSLFKGRPGEPIGWAQGFGILFDDFVAAGCTLLVTALWRWI